MRGQGIRTFFTRIRSKWNALVNKKETPRETQERHDLYKIALAVKYNDIRKKALINRSIGADSALPYDGVKSESVTPIVETTPNVIPKLNNVICQPKTHDREELMQFYDEATDILDKNEIYDSSIRELRREIQIMIRPQILAILNTCKIVGETLPSTTELEADSEEYVIQSAENKKRCKDILYEEQCQTLDLLDSLYSDRESSDSYSSGDDTRESSLSEFEKQTKQIIFLNKKKDAIQSIASFYSWEHFYFDGYDGINSADGVGYGYCNVDCNGADEFGYIQSTDELVNNTIRYYQMLNLSRSTLIRQKLGYSTMSLKSTIPNGGRGIYIDGFAPAGSIVAFFPGDVWPKEHLLNLNSMASYFNKDPRMHLSIRHDDILIDARMAPYTVLDDSNSNHFAVAHIANHPSKLDQPNCRTLAIDFIEDMKLKETNIDRYVPNTYKKKPMYLGPQAFDVDEIVMHSMGLMANRDLQNEEVLYDYRLTLGENAKVPSWYHICNQEEVDNLVR